MGFVAALAGSIQAEEKAFLAPAHDAAIYAYHYDAEPYRLDPGPHLFIDWRYVCPGYAPRHTHQGRDVPRDRPAEFSPETISQIRVEDHKAPFGVRLEVVRPEKLGPVLRPDKPWEFFLVYTNLIHTNGKYLLYYSNATLRKGEKWCACYAESTDGLHYTKPNLGVVEYDGSKNNNIVLGPGVCKHGVCGQGVFLDPHGPPEERFKALYLAEDSLPVMVAQLKQQRPESVSAAGEKASYVVMGAVSPDGIHWRELEEPLMAHYSDTGTTAYWDEHLQRYVGYFRMAAMERRCIGRAETPDFRRWPRPELILFPQPSDPSFVDYYTNGKSIYPGTETMHLMFPMIYQRNIDTSVMRVLSSMDGRVWGFLPGTAMDPGKEGEFDGGCIFPGAGLVEIPGDRVALPYCGFDVPHKFPRLRPLGNIALAVWRKERLGALVADEQGYFATVPVRAQGRNLWLNFETLRGGLVQVEIEGAAGRTFAACDMLYGNHLKKQVTWNQQADLGVEPGKRLVIHFRLRAAKLYSFEIK